METQYPLLTYGIFLPSEDNYAILENKTKSEESLDLPGFDMYYGLGSPKIVKGSGSIKASLIIIKENHYNKTLQKMDWLLAAQDETSVNKRVLHTFSYKGEDIQAWLYTNEKEKISEYVKPERLISNGDWARAKTERKLKAKTA